MTTERLTEQDDDARDNALASLARVRAIREASERVGGPWDQTQNAPAGQGEGAQDSRERDGLAPRARESMPVEGPTQ